MYTTTYRFKCYVQNDSHERKLRSLTSLCNFVYNHSIALIRRHYSLYGRTVPENELKRHFSKLKHGCHKELYDMSVETMQCLRDRAIRLAEAFQRAVIESLAETGADEWLVDDTPGVG